MLLSLFLAWVFILCLQLRGPCKSFSIPYFRYEMQDLHVTETLPQMVALSEAYMQIYEQHE